MREIVQEVRYVLSQTQNDDEKQRFIYSAYLRNAYGQLADVEYLAAEPEQAAEAMLRCTQYQESQNMRANFYSKYLFLRNYRARSPEESLQEARHYAELLPQHTALFGHVDHKKRSMQQDGKLHIGYISRDFRMHAVAYFIAPLLHNYDTNAFRVTCYSMGSVDAVTKKLRAFPVSWCNVQNMSYAEIARRIYMDRIDILFDLSGHSQNNALPVLAMCPAPVQISGIGYTDTTGLPAIQYFLSDEICLPHGDKAVQAFSEKVLRLPHSHLCYCPEVIRDMPKTAIEPPCMRKGYITFGSFNNFAKVTDDVLLLWRGILEQVPTAHLIIKGKICSVPSGIALLKKRLHRLSLDISRIVFRPYSPDYLEQYRDSIDIALDTMPYNGGLTTCEALYMGVPVITMRGRSHGARFGASILQNAGCGELVAENDVDYVRLAVNLANAKDRLCKYHATLRNTMQTSALMNAAQYMHELEDAYKRIVHWHTA